MWITRKQLNKMIERELESERTKHQSEMLDKELEISRLKTRLAMEELKQAIMGLEIKVCSWSDRWGIEETESEDK